MKPAADAVTIYIDGAAVAAEAGESVAAVLLRQSAALVAHHAGQRQSRRAPYCMMGVCFDCLAERRRRSLGADLPDRGARRHARRAPARQAERRSMTQTCDLLIVGAGPAGMAAAVAAAPLGLDVLRGRRAAGARRPDLARRSRPSPQRRAARSSAPLSAGACRSPRRFRASGARLRAGHPALADRAGLSRCSSAATRKARHRRGARRSCWRPARRSGRCRFPAGPCRAC